ncbi:DUF5366 family protein [Salibacterium aidingense]|uniref:DUF5366 family protein n=1 Tax=Salibacterium aidingense TaxID=384933 RepID=UPI00041584BC|nr:DUF5366 family protein [Salibacterium aidingense]
MKNTYLTSHFPLFSILLFGLSFALYAERLITAWLAEIGLYTGMLEFFSETGIRVTLTFFLLLFFFMIFSALKLIAGTMIELSLLFFSKDKEGEELRKIRSGTWIYFIASLLSLLFIFYPAGIAVTFLAATTVYFIYFVYRVSDSLSGAGMFGLIFFHISFWCVSAAAVGYAGLRLYNSFIKSLPL